MKPESRFQAKLLNELRKQAELSPSKAVIFKHSDMINGGVPDVSITLNSVTTWFELKVAPNKLSKLQKFYLDKLGLRAHLVTLKGKIIEIDGYSYTWDSVCYRIVELCQ